MILVEVFCTTDCENNTVTGLLNWIGTLMPLCPIDAKTRIGLYIGLANVNVLFVTLMFLIDVWFGIL